MSSVRDAHEFKPLLAEIEEAPASPLGHFTFWTVIVLVVIAVLWLCIGEVDVVVTARGKVVPLGQVKVIQPLDAGVLRAIHVLPGTEVHKGDVIVEIDPTSTAPALASKEQNLAYTQLEIQRINAMLTGSAFTPNAPGVDPATLATQSNLYHAGMADQNSKLAAKQQELQQITEQISGQRVTQQKSQELLALTKAKQTRLMPVKDIIPRREFDDMEKDVVTNTREAQEAAFKMTELTHKQAQVRQELGDLRQNFRTGLLGELSQKEKSRYDLTANVEEVGFRNRKQRLVSPVDGTVDQVFINTVGGVVTPAQKLMIIVPKDAPLQIEANIFNKDIGFVHPGQLATLKVETYEYQKYGTIPGRVEQVSSDSHAVDSGPQKGDPVYSSIIKPERLSMMVNGKRRPIRAGMDITVDINVTKRKLIEFFIYPLTKSLDESFRLR